MKTYSSIRASYDLKSTMSILKMFFLVAFMGIGLYTVYAYLIAGEILLNHATIGLIIPPCIYNFVQIMGYNKRDIIKIMQPSFSVRGIFSTLKTVLSHSVDLIVVPTFVALMLYFYFNTAFTGFDGLSVIFIVIYAIHILPLNLRKESYVQDANRSISQAIDVLRETRILMMTTDISDDEREYAVRRHVAAEEMQCVHSDFLVYSTSLATMMLTGVRYLIPILSPFIYIFIGG